MCGVSKGEETKVWNIGKITAVARTKKEKEGESEKHKYLWERIDRILWE